MKKSSSSFDRKQNWNNTSRTWKIDSKHKSYQKKRNNKKIYLRFFETIFCSWKELTFPNQDLQYKLVSEKWQISATVLFNLFFSTGKKNDLVAEALRIFDPKNKHKLFSLSHLRNFFYEILWEFIQMLRFIIKNVARDSNWP